MPSRDDSDLYTGLNPVASRRVRHDRQEHSDEKERQRAEAFKNGELIIEQLTTNEADLADRVFTLIDNADKEEDVRAKLMALRMERERIRIHKATFERLLKPVGGRHE